MPLKPIKGKLYYFITPELTLTVVTINYVSSKEYCRGIDRIGEKYCMIFPEVLFPFTPKGKIRAVRSLLNRIVDLKKEYEAEVAILQAQEKYLMNTYGDIL